MAHEPQKPDHISQADWDAADIPEMTDEEFTRARPFAEVFPEQYKAWKNKGGRPKSADPKVHIGLRLPSALAAWLKGDDGKGYNARAQAILQRAMDEATR